MTDNTDEDAREIPGHIITYNRKKHRYEYYEGTKLVAFSAYANRLSEEYPKAFVDFKLPIPNADDQVRSIDTEKDW